MGRESGRIDRVHDKTAKSPHHVAIVVFDGVELFELAVAVDVFGTVVTRDGGPLYRLSVCGPAPSVTTAAGFAMEVPNGLDAARAADTIVVTPAAVTGRAPALPAVRLRPGAVGHHGGGLLDGGAQRP